MTLNAVARLGKKTPKVSTPCNAFIAFVMPGSVYWWWNPVGIESSRKRMKTPRVYASLTIRPPACRGTRAYQET
jgi:hypothetical protein